MPITLDMELKFNNARRMVRARLAQGNINRAVPIAQVRSAPSTMPAVLPALPAVAPQAQIDGNPGILAALDQRAKTMVARSSLSVASLPLSSPASTEPVVTPAEARRRRFEQFSTMAFSDNPLVRDAETRARAKGQA